MAVKKNLVYSTDLGKRCPECGHAVSACKCKLAVTPPAGDGIVRLQRQTKGRSGKPVVVITGLALDVVALKKLASQLKARCGVGGTVENQTIVIQGDKREVLKRELESLGHTVKLSGG